MAILATQRVLTLDYWKFASDIVAGDVLFDREGQPVKVKLVQQYRAQDCYEVHFNDNLTVAGDSHLKLPTENEKYRNRVHSYKQRLKFKRPLKPLSVADLLQTSLIGRRNRLALSVPTAKPLQLPTQTLPVPPFVFGFWFFNEHYDQTLQPYHGTDDFVRRKFREAGYVITKTYKSGEFLTRPSVRSHLVPHLPTKIPNNYLLASAAQRLELLRGVMHAKHHQYNLARDTFRFSSKNQAHVAQIQYLAESLGIKTRMEYTPQLSSYSVFFRTGLQLMEQQISPPPKVHLGRRYINQISQLPDQLCVHIETDNPETGFLVGEGFIPTC